MREVQGVRGIAREVQGDEGVRKQGGGGRRVAVRAGHAPLPTGARRKATEEPRWWDGLTLPSWAATVVGRLGCQVSSLSFSFNSYFLFFSATLF